MTPTPLFQTIVAKLRVVGIQFLALQSSPGLLSLFSTSVGLDLANYTGYSPRDFQVYNVQLGHDVDFSVTIRTPGNGSAEYARARCFRFSLCAPSHVLPGVAVAVCWSGTCLRFWNATVKMA